MIINIHSLIYWAIRMIIAGTILSGPQIRTYMIKNKICKIGIILGNLNSGLIITHK